MKNEEFLESCSISVLDESLTLLDFDCLDQDINDFYRNDALSYQRDLRAKTYVLYLEDKIIAFYSVMNDKIDRVSNSIKQGNWQDKFSDKNFETEISKEYPAVKVGRLGVHKDFKGKGIGSFILTYIKASFSDPNNKTGCRFVTLDAYIDKQEFYEKNGFVELIQGNTNPKRETIPMFFDLKTFSL